MNRRGRLLRLMRIEDRSINPNQRPPTLASKELSRVPQGRSERREGFNAAEGDRSSAGRSPTGRNSSAPAATTPQGSTWIVAWGFGALTLVRLHQQASRPYLGIAGVCQPRGRARATLDSEPRPLCASPAKPSALSPPLPLFGLAVPSQLFPLSSENLSIFVQLDHDLIAGYNHYHEF